MVIENMVESGIAALPQGKKSLNPKKGGEEGFQKESDWNVVFFLGALKACWSNSSADAQTKFFMGGLS